MITREKESMGKGHAFVSLMWLAIREYPLQTLTVDIVGSFGTSNSSYSRKSIDLRQWKHYQLQGQHNPGHLLINNNVLFRLSCVFLGRQLINSKLQAQTPFAYQYTQQFLLYITPTLIRFNVYREHLFHFLLSCSPNLLRAEVDI